MKTIAPIFPTTLEDLKSNPAIIEHWPQVSRLITGYALTLLHNGALQGKEANTAEHAVGAQYAIGKMIEHFMQLGGTPEDKPKTARIAPLHRFTPDTPKPNTPEK